MRRCILLLVVCLAGCSSRPAIGSKKFTESVILGEMGRLLAGEAGEKVRHREQLGGTQILWQALVKGDIVAYPEYTGTLSEDIFRGRRDLDAALAEHGVKKSRPLGFVNSYALGMRAEQARKRNITNISDLQKHPELRYGFSEEFRNRADGWAPLRQHYGLKVPNDHVRVLDHDVALRGVEAGDLDVTDVYTTEGGLRLYNLVALKDDYKFFPAYDAVWVYRADAPQPVIDALLRLEGKISESDMLGLNVRARERGDETHLAAEFLRRKLGVSVAVEREAVLPYLMRLTGEHLFLVGVSLFAAVVIAIPLGILAARLPVAGQVILAVTGVLQTIPSLALLVFLIPVFHLGIKPAIIALFLYSLLPIVRNTHAGIVGISSSLRESAQVLGLPPGAVLRLIELPLASRSILAGIKTAAVINVGTATLGALIDAGGYGGPIFQGIRLGDNSLIMLGALPAAGLALLVQGLFELADHTLTPRGLRLPQA
jgi:osmoprotectant transport system permease protein